MNHKEFKELVSNSFKHIQDLEAKKAIEYVGTNPDRLSHFKGIAAFRNQTPQQALAGMMIKHTKSIYDMIDKDDFISVAVINEKIHDHIVYLLLLKGLCDDSWNCSIPANNSHSFNLITPDQER